MHLLTIRHHKFLWPTGSWIYEASYHIHVNHLLIILFSTDSRIGSWKTTGRDWIQCPVVVLVFAGLCKIVSTNPTPLVIEVGWLCWGLTSQSTIFQSCRDGAIASWVINQYFRGVKCLAQGHNTAEIGLEPRTSRSGVWHSTTEPPRSPCHRGAYSVPYEKKSNDLYGKAHHTFRVNHKWVQWSTTKRLL